jgi:hypothetical protein
MPLLEPHPSPSHNHHGSALCSNPKISAACNNRVAQVVSLRNVVQYSLEHLPCPPTAAAQGFYFRQNAYEQPYVIRFGAIDLSALCSAMTELRGTNVTQFLSASVANVCMQFYIEFCAPL